MSDKDDVIVIGAGIIGISCAHYLNRAGYQVTVIEKDTVAGACSKSNCGFICPSHVLPLTERGAVATAFKSLLNPNAPFRVKPSFDPTLWSWMFQFARRCNQETMVKAGHGLKSILDASMENYRLLIKEESIECEWRDDGLLYVFRNQSGMNGFAERNDFLSKEYNVRAKRLDGNELLQLDPALKVDLAGGFHYEGDASMKPEKLNKSWYTLLKKQGVTFIEQCALKNTARQSSKITGLITSQGEMKAGHYVLATGAWSPQWEKEFQCKLPIQPGKGYSVTLELPDPAPRYSMLFPEHRVGVTPFDHDIRLGSIMEFSGFDTSIKEERIHLLRESTNAYLKNPITAPFKEQWFGWRPMTYDSLPLIGPAPQLKNVHLAVGHNMIGLSLAPSTGRLIAEIMSGSEPHIDPRPYRPDRF